MKKQHVLLLALALLLVLILLTVLAGSMQPPQAPAPTPALDEESQGLEVHFIDVGQADSALLLCDGQAMLIDGGNVEDSSLVSSYLEGQGVTYLDYVVCTHAHEDHVGGLSGPMNTCTVGEVLCPVDEYDSKAFRDFDGYAAAQGLPLTAPEPDGTFPLGAAEVTVLGPRQEYSDTNNTSIVLRVDYGATSFLFTGDMERDAEADLIAAGCDLHATVLKAGHHGSDTSTSYPFLREVLPDYAVISVGEGNTYGHPGKETMSRLSDAGVKVYRTDLLGTVVAVSDGLSVTFYTEKGGNPLPDREGDTGPAYIGNRKSQIFHLESCANLPGEQNRVYFDSRTEALTAGYTPCGSCKP